ncbi:MAG TPA: hypothetical protein VMS63_00720 [Gaiellaceae bacterium]|nr:hypothetical protein [Gaiellaceae bacterium]
MDDAKRVALAQAKARLDRLELYPRPVSLRGVRIWIVPRLFRLPWFRRFDGYSAHRTILLRSRDLLADGELVAHELCHVWQMQHRPVRMPLSYLVRGYASNPYEREARDAEHATLDFPLTLEDKRGMHGHPDDRMSQPTERSWPRRP